MQLGPDDEQIAREAWLQYGDPRRVVSVEEHSANVSTNRVYRLELDDGRECFAKTSSYGSYVHFRQDHRLIQRWADLLVGSRYEHLLAPVAVVRGEVFTAHFPPSFVVFYQPAPYRDFLPRRLSDNQVEAFGEEMALFHAECTRCAKHLQPSWKSLGSDIATLYDSAGNEAWLQHRGFSRDAERTIKRQCDYFLSQAELLGYHDMPRIPVLLDWNIGNFSVAFRDGGESFELFSRWDYDWFRIEPRILDFYFCSRVVRSDGDQTTFSYLPDTLAEPRFVRFLRAYRRIFPLREKDVLFLKEAYRFFILNYVLRSGEHFFKSNICARLQRESLQLYLPALDQVALDDLCDAVFR